MEVFEMTGVLMFIIGFIVSATLRGGGIEINTFNFWIIVGCVIAASIIGYMKGGSNIR